MREWQESVADKQIDWMPVEVAPYHALRCWGFLRSLQTAPMRQRSFSRSLALSFLLANTEVSKSRHAGLPKTRSSDTRPLLGKPQGVRGHT